MIPNEKSYCELDPDVVDRWGIPVLRFHWQWSENETEDVRGYAATFRSVIETGGGTVPRFLAGTEDPRRPSRRRRNHS